MSEKDLSQLQDDKLAATSAGFSTMWENGNIVILPLKEGNGFNFQRRPGV
ncbi:MAG: hypothetical protein LBJ95_00880 [Oscillospiraceae bacterium]|nr:hypothetical protein [Oscillospiraceae bacterium]